MKLDVQKRTLFSDVVGRWAGNNSTDIHVVCLTLRKFVLDRTCVVLILLAVFFNFYAFRIFRQSIFPSTLITFRDLRVVEIFTLDIGKWIIGAYVDFSVLNGVYQSFDVIAVFAARDFDY